MVPTCRPNFAEVACPTYKVNCAGEVEISCPLVTHKVRAWDVDTIQELMARMLTRKLVLTVYTTS